MRVQPAWSAVESRLAAELGGSWRLVETLGKPRANRLTWAAEADELGALIVKGRYGDRADEKTRWAAANLPLLAARGYPAPEVVWHGPLESEWYVIVERRLPGSSLHALEPRLLDALLELVELQAGGGVDPRPARFRRLPGVRPLRRLGSRLAGRGGSFAGGEPPMRSPPQVAPAGAQPAAAGARLRPQRPSTSRTSPPAVGGGKTTVSRSPCGPRTASSTGWAQRDSGPERLAVAPEERAVRKRRQQAPLRAESDLD